jgi:putative transposase
MKVRRLDEQGRLLFAGQTGKTTISKLIAREPIGLNPIDEDRWELFYGPVLIAEMMLRGKDIRFDRKR